MGAKTTEGNFFVGNIGNCESWACDVNDFRIIRVLIFIAGVIVL